MSERSTANLFGCLSVAAVVLLLMQLFACTKHSTEPLSRPQLPPQLQVANYPAVEHGSSRTVDTKNTGLLEKVVPDLSGLDADVHPQVADQVLQFERQGKGRKIIAMSLFGDNPRYVDGAILNALLAKRDWPDWTLRIYYGEGVPLDAVATITSMGAEMVKVDLVQNARVSMYWRFFALEDRTATRILSRDADAQLTLRDRAAVSEWIDSGRFFHTLHDHPDHAVPILGGMWGAVNGFLHPRIISAWRKSKDQTNAVWGNDQDWLHSVVWPLVKQHTLDHSSFLCHVYGAAEWRGFPTKRLHEYDFVGNAYRPENRFVGMAVPAVCPDNCRRHSNWTSC